MIFQDAKLGKFETDGNSNEEKQIVYLLIKQDGIALENEVLKPHQCHQIEMLNGIRTLQRKRFI